MKTPSTYLNSFPDSIKVLKNKNILFDSNVLINLLDDFNTDLLDILKQNVESFCIIHPVIVELLNSNNPAKRTERQLTLSTYNFITLPLIKPNFDNARNIQIWLSARQCFPEPTDLYLGGVLTHYGNLYLATSNLKHFPSPLFTRECYAIIQNSNKAQIINFLRVDKTLLDKETSIKS